MCLCLCVLLIYFCARLYFISFNINSVMPVESEAVYNKQQLKAAKKRLLGFSPRLSLDHGAPGDIATMVASSTPYI